MEHFNDPHPTTQQACTHFLKNLKSLSQVKHIQLIFFLIQQPKTELSLSIIRKYLDQFTLLNAFFRNEQLSLTREFLEQLNYPMMHDYFSVLTFDFICQHLFILTGTLFAFTQDPAYPFVMPPPEAFHKAIDQFNARMNDVEYVMAFLELLKL